MKHHFILNPAAGKGNRIAEVKYSIKKICDERGIDYVIYDTTAVGDATRYIKDVLAEGTGKHRFYACGGDGTLCEVITGAFDSTDAEVALIPIGTGNDFHRNFTERDCFFDIERQLDGKAIDIDAIKINDRHAINMINIGFDGNVVGTVAKIKRKKILPGKFAYIAGVVINFFKKFGTPMKLTIGDEVRDEVATLCAISGGGYCGGGFHSSPLSSLSDGLLDVYFIKKISRLTFIKLIGSYKNGTYLETKLGKKIVYHTHTDKLTLEFTEPINVCIDGEVEQMSAIDISCIPRAIRFAPPRGSSLIISEEKQDEKEPALV